jgi:hypothetical protein
MMAMEATIFTGWIYDHLLPHAEKVKVAQPLIPNPAGVHRGALLLEEAKNRIVFGLAVIQE